MRYGNIAKRMTCKQTGREVLSRSRLFRSTRRRRRKVHDVLALDPPIARAAQQIQRSWTPKERLARARWAYGVEVSFNF